MVSIRFLKTAFTDMHANGNERRHNKYKKEMLGFKKIISFYKPCFGSLQHLYGTKNMDFHVRGDFKFYWQT